MATVNKIGIVGLTHDHVWHNLDAIKEVEDCEITCVADPNEPLLQKVNEILNLDEKKLYKDYQEMLEREQLDAVLIFAATYQHADLVEVCAAKGLHMMVEKPMARNVAECDRMIKAANDNNVRLMINFPTMWNADLRTVVDLIREGAIGKLWMVKYRDGHKGPKELGCSEYFLDWLYDQEKNGGGALIDFCIYGANTTAALLGRPTEITGAKAKLLKKELNVEDNGVIIAKFGEDAMAVIEGTWTQMAHGNTLGFFGTTGTISTNAFVPREYFINTLEGGLKKMETRPFPEEENRAIKYFVRRVRNNQPFDYFVDAEHARLAQEYVDAAFRSIEAGKPVQL